MRPLKTPNAAGPRHVFTRVAVTATRTRALHAQVPLNQCGMRTNRIAYHPRADG